MSLLDLARGEIRSYRQLPVHLFQFKTRWQPAEYPGSGLWMRMKKRCWIWPASTQTADSRRKGGRQLKVLLYAPA